MNSIEVAGFGHGRLIYVKANTIWELYFIQEVFRAAIDLLNELNIDIDI